MIKENDRGLRELRRRLRKKGTVKVGILGAKGNATHQGTDLTVVEIGSFHEFGLGVPKRSFIRDWFDLNEQDLKRDMKQVARRVLKGSKLKKELDRFGLKAVGSIQERIASNIPPPLSDETKQRKGSNVALIDTGQLRSSISHQTEVR